MSTPTADPVKLMRLKSTSYAAAQPLELFLEALPGDVDAVRHEEHRTPHCRPRAQAGTRVLYMQSAATSTSNDGRLLAGASMSRRLVESSMPCLSAAISSILRGSGFVSVDVTTAPARAATREHRPVPQPTSSTPLPSTSISPA
eukprot:CAMPEP_0206282500 /NCGR_PEP_ID=MMETSP0047_2-20121206/39720_1 /ASSEMBLY_ACC=CAM_ASM_000192 /TAXON_ID=195065 /ORGANISM="Chroomonas mesostigmatica_cf, Strain CCMP1168" /LENGTH=143 /DNA_ID=CAMNT_0053712783 /DNA_START=169 /DNA_END=599 /DNA_ORIENTATION=-